ncbi:MAG: stomatin-like protein [Trueperaceae bacterium]|nr:stomatin-like protein [Trueperaceae bacterium]
MPTLVIVLIATGSGLLVFLLVSFLMLGVFVVKQAETVLIERFGRYRKTLSSGVNVLVPLIDQPREMLWRRKDPATNKFVTVMTSRIDLREQVYSFTKQSVITKDNVNTGIDAVLYFRVVDPKKAIYEIENLPDALSTLTQTNLRNVIGELDLDETLVSRDKINTRLRQILNEAAEKWGVQVNRIELQNISPPQEIQEALEQQIRADRESKATLIRAEARKKSKILDSEGDSQARLSTARAEADAITMLREASGHDPSRYLINVRYLDTLKEMVSGKDNKVVYMPFEASGFLGAVGGLREMLSGLEPPTSTDTPPERRAALNDAPPEPNPERRESPDTSGTSA